MLWIRVGIASCAALSLQGEMSPPQDELSSSGLVPRLLLRDSRVSQALLAQPHFTNSLCQVPLCLPQPLMLNFSCVILPWVLGWLHWMPLLHREPGRFCSALWDCSPKGLQSSWRELEPPALGLVWPPRAELCLRTKQGAERHCSCWGPQ